MGLAPEAYKPKKCTTKNQKKKKKRSASPLLCGVSFPNPSLLFHNALLSLRMSFINTIGPFGLESGDHVDNRLDGLVKLVLPTVLINSMSTFRPPGADEFPSLVPRP